MGRGGFGTVLDPDARRVELDFFLGAGLRVAFFADDFFFFFFVVDFAELFAADDDTAAFTGVGVAAIGAVAAGLGGGAEPSGGTPIGATLPVDTDVVVLLACCVPFVDPNRPAMNGFAMQS